MLTVFAYRADDLIPEENVVVQLALKRLSSKEAYDRVFRMRRAFQVRMKLATDGKQNVAEHILIYALQCSLQHQLLPQDEWTTDEEVSTLGAAVTSRYLATDTRTWLLRLNG